MVRPAGANGRPKRSYEVVWKPMDWIIAKVDAASPGQAKSIIAYQIIDCGYAKSFGEVLKAGISVRRAIGG